MSQTHTKGKKAPLPPEYRDSVINCILQKTNTGASTVTLQLMDPTRFLLNHLLKQGDTLEIDGLRFTLVQSMKAGEQLQMVFEAECINRLRNQRNPKGTKVTTAAGTGITPFFAGLVGALNKGVAPHNPKYVHFVGPDYAAVWSKLTKKPIIKQALGRGTTTDPNEDSWTCMSRIASAVGWRLWEDDNTIYFGPDEWWAGDITPDKLPYINNHKKPKTVNKHVQKLQESTGNTQVIDFDWDVGKPFGAATVTAMMGDFYYQIGEIIDLVQMGPASGHWMVTQMQRDAFSQQATMVLSVPMPLDDFIDPTSLPVAGFPLPVRGVR